METDPAYLIKKFAIPTLLIAAIFTGLILFSRSPSIEEHVRVHDLYRNWKASPQDETAWHTLSQTLQNLSFAREKYTASIAQDLLNQKRHADAGKIAPTALQSLYKTAPYHATYAKTSFLIAEGHYQEALEQAVHLKEKLADLPSLDSSHGGGVLYGFNLLRIACLQNSLKNRSGELQALEELEQFLSKQDDPELTSNIVSSFQEQGFTLNDYIAYRKAQVQEK